MVRSGKFIDPAADYSDDGSHKRKKKQHDEARARGAAVVAPSSGVTARQAARRHHIDREPNVSKWRYYIVLALVCGGGLQFALMVYMSLVPTITSLSSERTAELHQVFFSGQPWMVLCHNDSGPVSPIWSKAAAIVRERGVDGLQVGILDCDQPLPSGKSAITKFGFNPKLGPVAFWVANGIKPTAIPSAYLTNSYAETAPQSLYEYVTKQIAPRSATVTHTKQLHNGCLAKKKCALLYHGDKLSTDDKSLLSSLMSRFRQVRFVTVDHKKYELSLENKLPPAVIRVTENLDTGKKVKQIVPRLVFFKRISAGESDASSTTEPSDSSEGSSSSSSSGDNKSSSASPSTIHTSARAYRDGDWDLASITAFLDSVVADEVKLSGLSKLPAVRIRSTTPYGGAGGGGRRKRSEKPEMQADDELEPQAEEQEAVGAGKRKRASVDEENSSTSTPKPTADSSKKPAVKKKKPSPPPPPPKPSAPASTPPPSSPSSTSSSSASEAIPKAERERERKQREAMEEEAKAYYWAEDEEEAQTADNEEDAATDEEDGGGVGPNDVAEDEEVQAEDDSDEQV